MRGLMMLLVLLLMLALVAVGGWLIIESIPGWADRGAFGSMFEPIQAIISGIAIVGVVYTIFLQQEALRIQNEGLAETRRELTHATEMQEQSLQALHQQVEALRETARTSSLSVLLPILQQRIASIPEPARNS